jgi:hypothetical protein
MSDSKSRGRIASERNRTTSNLQIRKFMTATCDDDDNNYWKEKKREQNGTDCL